MSGTSAAAATQPAAAAGLWMDQEYRYLMLCTGDSLADPVRVDDEHRHVGLDLRSLGAGTLPARCRQDAGGQARGRAK
jgi:hypothetical protein